VSVLAALGAACSGHAQQLISVKLASPKNSNQNWMFAGDYAGAPGVRTNNWNNLLAASDGSGANISLLPGSVSNSAGAILPDLGVSYHAGTTGNIYNRGNGATNDGKLFMDVTDTYGAGSLASYNYLLVTNIPYTNYNVYVYFLPDNGSGSGNTRGGVFCITNTPAGTNCVYLKNQSNDVSYTVLPAPTSSTYASAYVQSTTVGIASGGAAWNSIQGGNYGVFYGLTNSECRILFAGLGNGSGAKDPYGNYVNGGSAAVRFKVAGFQIYQVPSASPTNLYLQSSTIQLHAGNPAGTPVVVMSDLSDGTRGVVQTRSCTFSVDNPLVATVSAAGVITPGTNGAANLVVTQTNVNLSLTNPITVLGPTSLSIALAKTNLLVGNAQGDATTATVNANYSDAANVAVNGYTLAGFSASPSGVLSVTTNGILTAIGVGSAEVIASYAGLSVTSAVVTVSAFAAPGSVDSFAVKLTDSVATHAMAFHDLAGAPGVRFAYWNNLPMGSNPGTTTNSLAPVNYHGNALPNTLVQVMSGALQQNSFNTIGTATTNESALFDTFLDQGMNNGTTVASTLVVSNVPYASYDAYFYFYNDNGQTGRPTQVTVGGTTQYRINSASAATQPDDTGSGYVIASPQPGSLPASIANVPAGNVIKFSSLTDTTLTATWAGVGQDYIADAQSVTRARLVGFQLVKTLDGLAATNVYLTAPVAAQLAGNPAGTQLTLLADFTDGTKGGNITALSGVSYATSDAGVFSVDSGGAVTAGLNPGVATLTITYQANTLQASVTNLGPTAVRVVAAPSTVYLDGSLGLLSSKASAYADFAGTNNVNISGFNSVSYVDQGSPVCSLASGGDIAPNSVSGAADLGASYLGTNYVTAKGFTVRSVSDAPVLVHAYLFTNAPNSSVVKDTVGTANGTVYGPYGTNMAITFDGARAIFPGDADYSAAPYISLQAGIINRLGDVTIELWGGQSRLNAWARFLGFGTTAKGLDPHNTGAESTYLQLLSSYVGTGHAAFYTPSHGADAQAGFSLTNGAEYHFVMVYAPNAGTAAFYINGVLIGSGTPQASALSTSVNDTVDWLGVSLANTDLPLAGWMNKLAIYEGALSAAQILANYNDGQSLYLSPVTVATNVVSIAQSFANGHVNLSWPSDHKGWRLQVQTNSVSTGLGTNWVTVPGSTSLTNLSIPVDPANGAVFYRLVYP
jgi:hypothetical protein